MAEYLIGGFFSLFMLTSQIGAGDLSGLSGLHVEEEFRPLLAAMPLQMENGGTRIFKVKDGSLWIVSIGSAVTKPMSGSELLRRRTVSKSKAQAAAVAELNGIEVKTKSVMTSSDEVIIKNGVESGISQEVMNETVVTAAKGVIKNMPVVGTWMNPDQTLFLPLSEKDSDKIEVKHHQIK